MPVPVWLAVYVACSLSLLASLWMAVFPTSHGSLLRPLVGGALTAVAAFTAAIGFQSFVDRGSALLPWLLLGGVAVATAVVGTLFGESRLGKFPRWRDCGRCLICLVALVGVTWQFRHALDSAGRELTDLSGELDAARMPTSAPFVWGLTDCGRRIELHRFPDTDIDLSPHANLSRQFTQRAIAQELGESKANCHGWLFTAGQFLIENQLVDTILCDNGYRAVEAPQPGDLIVYRNSVGHPVHTGLVKAVGAEGFVLIESKWGRLDAFLHQPKDQPYSSSFAYYRSPRGSHLLQIVEPQQL